MEAAALDERPVFGEIIFMGEQFYCDHEGALFWPEKNLMIVSDLHMEKGAAMAMRGVMVPPYDTGATLHRLTDCIERWKPQTVVCLGDSFHRDDSADNLPAQFLSKLESLMQDRKWLWITGNHDPMAPEGLAGICLDEMSIGAIHFRHEQQREGTKGEISGHLHPVAIVHRRGKNLRRRCFASDKRRLILPAFGAYTGGLNVRSEVFAGLFNEKNLHVWMLGRQRVYEISGRHLTG